MKYQDNHIFTGMQRDLSVSKHPAQFLYDGKNIRLTAREGNTLYSITNEKGTLDTNVSVTGNYVGHCLLNNFLVVFTVQSTTVEEVTTSTSYITRLDLNQIINPDSESAVPVKVVLFSGNLRFSTEHPIDAIGYYESEKIQKVYWTDGENQPRIINITAEEFSEDLSEWTTEDYNNYATKLKYTEDSFDFIVNLKFQEEVQVVKLLSVGGTFAPGVIQYAFTYYNKYRQESAIFYTTPLYYISHADRGGSPEDTSIDNAFQITVKNVDKSFDYLRIYSIQRTSRDATPYVKRIQDISLDFLASPVITDYVVHTGNTVPVCMNGESVMDLSLGIIETGAYMGSDASQEWYKIMRLNGTDLKIITTEGTVTWSPTSTDSNVIYISKTPFGGIYNKYGYYIWASSTNSLLFTGKVSLTPQSVSFTDTGNTGDVIDPTELLYKGGEIIKAKTLEQKDNTLFLGNIDINRKSIHNLFPDIKEDVVVSQTNNGIATTRQLCPKRSMSGDYIYDSQLTSYGSTYSNLKKSVPCAGFKKGNTYRLGMQFQHKSGMWSDPVWIKDEEVVNSFTANVSSSRTTISSPEIHALLKEDRIQELLDEGYLKIRGVVVFPTIKDRNIICQGVVNPTMYTDNNRNSDINTTSTTDNSASLYAQSSWFFRAHSTLEAFSNTSDKGTSYPVYNDGEVIRYIGKASDFNMNTGFADIIGSIRQAEIQGLFEEENQFRVDWKTLTMHSPDIYFEDYFSSLDFNNTECRQVGNAIISNTQSDILIQTDTPTASTQGGGFLKKTFISAGMYSILSGTFYEDFIVDDTTADDQLKQIEAYTSEKSPVKWLVYPWNKSGSLNNDIKRPADQGTQTAVLKKKIISNLHFSESSILLENYNTLNLSGKPELFSSNQEDIIKVNSNVYQGNINTILTPDATDGMYFTFGYWESSQYISGNNQAGTIADNYKVTTPFKSGAWWKTDNTKFSVTIWGALDASGAFFYHAFEHKWYIKDACIGDIYKELVAKKEFIRMKYKSTPHLVFSINSTLFNYENNAWNIPIVEATRPSIENLFGGTSEDALKENVWVPCGEPVLLNTSNTLTVTEDEESVTYTGTLFKFSYGDTYYQRWDCLKTYPFTNEDENQIVEIGSFMLETYVNIDGRYDRNRGQVSNINMSPKNFNLLNPVYSQLDNFFSYKIFDDDYYKNTSFPNQITWTKEKQSGADVDLWTNLTLSSTYDLDGSKGEITSINLWKDTLFCFQKKGVSNILFNSRVQIPTSDGLPIEITNGYKVEGCRYISDGIGCNDKRLVKESPQGIYFIDSTSNHFFYVGESIKDLSSTCNLSSTFSTDSDSWEKILYDDVNHDVYIVNDTHALCYSEALQQFTGYMDYATIPLIETYNRHVFTMQNSNLYRMFEGDDYCNFFGINYDWYFTFISNGISNNHTQMTKIFTNLEFRSCVATDGILDDEVFTPTLPIDSIEVWNEYQHGFTNLVNSTGSNMGKHFIGKDSTASNSLKRKFRIWSCDVPRNNAVLDSERNPHINYKYALDSSLGLSRLIRKPTDRMSNPWLFIKAKQNAVNNMKKVELHDIAVTYFG